MKKYIILAGLLGCLMTVFSQGINFFHGTFEEALEKAKTENKLLFIDCYTSWCGPCRMLQTNIFPLEQVGDFFNQNFICYKIDCEKDQGPDICSRFNVSAYPTMHFVDATGKSVYKTMGYQGAEALIEQGKKAMGGSSNVLREYQNKYQNGDRTEDNLYGLLNQLAKNGQPYDDIFKEYLATQKPENLLMEKNAKLIFELTRTINSPAITHFQGFKPYFTEKYGAESYERRVEQIAANSVKEAFQKTDKKMFLSTVDFIKNNDISRSEEVILKESMLFYRETGDMVSYDAAVTKYLKVYKKNDSRLMAEVASLYYEMITNPKLLSKAVNWSLLSIKIEDMYYNNIALAQLYYKLGKKDTAYETALHAMELGKKESVNYWRAQDLINKIQIERGTEKNQNP